MNEPNQLTPLVLIALLIALPACGGEVENPEGGDEQEVLTTVELTFTPQGGGDEIVALFSDPDGDGGEEPTTTNPNLATSTTYDVSVRLLNETVPETDEDYNIGAEVAEEAEEHQLFYTGSAIDGGLLTWMYEDVESDYTTNTGDDLPLGLRLTMTTDVAGSGELTVTLQHQPSVNDVDVKTSSSVINDGETDISVTFDVTVE